jgi:hypothetical protein
MGFHVICSGADLLRQLRRQPELLLGAPYAFYVFILATTIDDKVLTWLHKYEMQLDSLFGPYGAFFVFYNEARLQAKPFPKVYHPEEPLSPNNRLVEIPVEPAAFASGSWQIDEAVRYNPKAYTNKKILVTCMTYESDAVARELGLVDKLPCMVFFDDPASKEYFYLSLDDPNRGTVVELRKLLSSVLEDKANSNYLAMLRSWHEAHDELQQVKSERLKRLTNKLSNPDYVYVELNRALDLLKQGKTKSFRSCINVMASRANVSDKLPWSEIRASSSAVGSSISLAKSVSSPRLAAIEHDAALRKARALVNCDQTIETAEILSRLRQRADDKSQEAVRIICKALNLPDLAGNLPPSLVRLDTRQVELNQKLQVLSSDIRELQRPSLRKHIKTAKIRRWGIRQTNNAQGFLSRVLQKAPSMLDAVKKGLELFP